MLYHLFDWLEQNNHFPGGRLFQYITFRAGLSMIISLVIMVVMGKRLIRSIKNWQVKVKLRVLAVQAKADLKKKLLYKIELLQYLLIRQDAATAQQLAGLEQQLTHKTFYTPEQRQALKRAGNLYLEAEKLYITTAKIPKIQHQYDELVRQAKQIEKKYGLDQDDLAIDAKMAKVTLTLAIYAEMEVIRAEKIKLFDTPEAKMLADYAALVQKEENPLHQSISQKGQELKALLASKKIGSDEQLDELLGEAIETKHEGGDIELEEQRNLGLPEEQLKAKTPTMGGIIIHLAILVPCLLLADLTNVYIQLLLLSTVMMGFIGFLDDYLKLTKGKDGLAGRYKIMGQVVLGAIVGATMLFHDGVVVRVSKADVQRYSYDVVDTVMVDHHHLGTKEEMYYVKTTMTNVPFFKGNEFDYRVLVSFLGENGKNLVWLIFIPIIIFIITAVSNAANLTDGIDGLAAGTSAITGATLAVLAYISGNTVLSDYLGVMYVPHAGELAIFTACFMGACIGFLWYNAYPAKVFMGDTGSLALGSIIAVLAIVIRKELLIPLLCGIFLVENLSVILQKLVFKYRLKKYGRDYAEKNRLFLMSPIHHHFQKQGMHESQIVVRFWIVGIILAVLTIITLKVR